MHLVFPQRTVDIAVLPKASLGKIVTSAKARFFLPFCCSYLFSQMSVWWPDLRSFCKKILAITQFKTSNRDFINVLRGLKALALEGIKP